MTEVDLSQGIYSEVPGRVGNWDIVRRVELPAVPRAGDWVEPAENWGLVPVRYTAFVLNGTPEVVLEPVKTDSPERLDEVDRLVSDHGWKQIGGPWRDQST